MKKLLSFVLLIFLIQLNATAQCNSGPLTVSGTTLISGSCTITGDLTIVNGGILEIDLTNATADTFVVRGNILLQGNAMLWVHSTVGSNNDQFIVSNNYNTHRNIVSQDSSRIQLENIEFRTQEGNLSSAASIYMSYDVEDNSIFYIDACWLDRQTAWLLCNLKTAATLIGYEPNGVPTEMYLQDSSQIELHGPNTDVGIWVTFDSMTDTMNLPSDQSQPFTWNVGRGAGGLATPWYLEIDTAKPGLGVQIFPTAQITINGAGFPVTGELKVALMFANGTDTLDGLQVGLQNTTVYTGPTGYVAMNNVNLGPIAWQVYALMNENLIIKNSIVNELGVAGPSSVVVDSSILQLAVLAAVGVGGSSLTINNSDIWNQSITAANNSTVILNNCNVTGSAFSTDAQSSITVNGGCFFQNPSGCNQSIMVNISTGLPYCNPFIPPGFPQNLTPSTVTFNGVNSNCVIGIPEGMANNGIIVFPNPVTDMLQVTVSDSITDYSVEIYSMTGQRLFWSDNISTVDLSDFAEGIYMLVVIQEDRVWVNKIAKQ